MGPDSIHFKSFTRRKSNHKTVELPQRPSGRHGGERCRRKSGRKERRRKEDSGTPAWKKSL